jgi:MFS family permease
VVDAARRLHGDVHAPARHHDRERGLPDIQKGLGSSFSDLQWVVDAYALMLASLLLTAGSLGDILGRLVFASGSCCSPRRR